MANHYEIKPDENGLALRMAMKALRSANGQATANPGSVYIPNGDGTGTLIGSQASDGAGGFAPFVGDTTPPGKPTGVSVTSTWGIIYTKWDGTLEGGVPADFAYVSITIDGEEVAQMVKAGTLTSQGWENGTIHTVGFTAYDSARDSLGNLTPNASETVEISVTVEDERAEIDAKVDAAEEAANQAAQAAQEAWDKAEQQAQAVADAADKAQQAADKADQAMSDLSDTADELTGQIADITKTVTEQGTKIDGAVKTAEGALTATTELSQTVEGVSASATQALEKADSALNKAAEVELTADGLSTQVTAAMDTATDALNKAAEVEVTADGIQADLTKNYVSKTDAANTYTTKTEFKATSEGLQADISEVTTTAEGALEKANSLEVTAEGLRADLTETTSTADSALNKANTTEVTVNGMKQTLTETTNTANSALNKSTSLETSVNGIKTQVESVSDTADSALSQASAAQQDITGFKTTVSNTYETKKDADDAMAQEVLDRNSAISQKADQILSEVSENYVDNETGQTYATKTQVNQLPDQILNQVESKYQSKDGMSSYYTKTQIDQQRDQIELGVSQSIDDISIGGTNLSEKTGELQTSYFSILNSHGTGAAIGSDAAAPSGNYYSIKPASNAIDVYFNGSIGDYVSKLKSGQQYVVSAWLKTSAAVAKNFTFNAEFLNVQETHTVQAKTTWQRVWLVGTYNGNTTSRIAITFYNGTNLGNVTLYISSIKVEMGNKPTDWSPAPEDTAKKLSSITVDLTEITGQVSDLNGNQSKLTQTVNGFEGRLTTAESDIDKAQTTASNANTAAGKAQSTADSANTKATNAQTAATNAAKTATNYISWSTNGLVVGTNSGGTGQTNLLGNTRMYSGGMEVRNGTTVLARYGASLVELGLNSSSSVIKMCGGKAQISASGKEVVIQSNSTGTSSEYSGVLLRPNSSTPYGVLIAHGYFSETKPLGTYIDLNLEGITATGMSGILDMSRFSKRISSPARLWSGNIAKNGTFSISGKWSDYRMFAVRLRQDGVYLTGTACPWPTSQTSDISSGQIHLIAGTDSGSGTNVYVASLSITSSNQGKYMAGGLHNFHANTSESLNLTEVWGIC